MNDHWFCSAGKGGGGGTVAGGGGGVLVNGEGPQREGQSEYDGEGFGGGDCCEWGLPGAVLLDFVPWV